MRRQQIKGMEMLVNLEIVDLSAVPRSRNWINILKDIPYGKAVKLTYNNRQRAHQVANAIRSSAKRYHIKIHTRVLHESPPIFDKEGWMVYYWLAKEATD